MRNPAAEPLDLSVVIPCYNEAQAIGGALDRVHAYLTGHQISHEIIVADDGSRDDTRTRVQASRDRLASVRLLELPHRGKGAAVREGMRASRGSLALFMDADQSTPIDVWPAFRDAVRHGADVVIASRELPGSAHVISQPLYRRVIGRLINRLTGKLFGLPHPDTQCGFKLFTRRAVDLIFPRQQIDGFTFDIELLYLARILDLKTEEIAVPWTNRFPSRVSLGRDVFPTLRDLVSLRLRSLRSQRRNAQ